MNSRSRSITRDEMLRIGAAVPMLITCVPEALLFLPRLMNLL